MITTIIVIAFAVFFAFIEGYKKDHAVLYNQKRSFDWLLLAFVIIYIFQAIRFDFGNDYVLYSTKFYEARDLGFSFLEISKYSGEANVETGYILLCKLFLFNNFQLFIAFLSLINCIAYYKLIKNHVPKKYYWFALAIYLIWPVGMLIQISAIRQTIAICMAIWAFKYFQSKNFLKYELLVLIAASIHSSAIILAPIFFLNYAAVLKKYMMVLIPALFIGVFAFSELYFSASASIISDFFTQYTYVLGSHSNTRSLTIVEVIMKVVLISVILYLYKHGSLIQRQYVILGYFFILFSILVSVIPFSDRLMMYFVPFIIIALSHSFKIIKNSLLKKGLVAMILLYVMIQFYRFFFSEVWGEHYYIYKTIFDL